MSLPKERTALEIRPINSAPKAGRDLHIREIFNSDLTRLVKDRNYGSLTADPDFGQAWNLSNLTVEDVYYFGNQYYKQKNDENFRKKIEQFYATLVRLNPELQNIRIDNMERMLDVIRGIGSGLHFNDIKYFVEDLEGGADKESPENAELWEKAFTAYMQRHGVDLEAYNRWDSDTEPVTPELLRALKLDNKVGYAFCPETCRRIINNQPYPKEKSETPKLEIKRKEKREAPSNLTITRIK